jgi:Glycosyl hydrolase family 71
MSFFKVKSVLFMAVLSLLAISSVSYGQTSWTNCGGEYGTCPFTGTKVVAYGANNIYSYKVATGGIACTNAILGNPVPNVTKTCFIMDLPATGWQSCGAENGNCAFTGPQTVAYGSGSSFTVKTLTGGTACTNAVFGTPTTTVGKTCYITSPPLDPCLPFNMPPSAGLFAAKHRTFAHYFYPFPMSYDNLPASDDYYAVGYLNPNDATFAATGGHLRVRPLPVTPSAAGVNYLVVNMEREVRMAISRGITGFEVDIMNVTDVTPNATKPADQPVLNLVKAAQAVDTRFQLLLMPDMSALKGGTADVITIVKAMYKSPGLYHDPTNGRLVISPFCSECILPAAWATALQTLATDGYPVAFYPTFTGLTAAYVTDYGPSSVDKTYLVGISQWATPSPGQSVWYPDSVTSVHAVGLPLMEGLGSQEYRPYASLYYEANNSLAYRNGWTGSMGADIALIDTWSDLSEGAAIEPVTDLEGTSGNGFYNLTGYYASMYATGVAPAITHDVLYYFYRKEPTTAVAPKQTSLAKLSFGTATNEIELLAFLTAPGTLTITIDGKTYTQSAPAGMTSFMVPTAPGTPTFSLVRSGAKVISFASGPLIYGAGGLPNGTQDLTYWSGSASAAGVCSITPPNPP